MRRTVLLTAVFAASGLAGPPADPDFTGIWTLDPDSSQIAGIMPAPPHVIRIKHEGPVVWCNCQPEWGDWTFTADRREARIRSGQLTLSTIAKWEGDALLVNTIVYGPSSSYTQVDRWRLSRGGLRLTIRREVILRNQRTREALLVYDRDTVEPAQPEAVAERSVSKAAPPPPARFRVDRGTRIPLTFLNSINTKQTGAGDRIYLETAFPIVVRDRVVVPRGSYVAATVVVKRPRRGRAEIHLRFDSITLPNGVTRDFRAPARGAEDEAEYQETAAGAPAGAAVENSGGRAAIGTAVGGAAPASGAMSVLLTRGPGVVLARGTTIDMVLDRPLVFMESELSR